MRAATLSLSIVSLLVMTLVTGLPAYAAETPSKRHMVKVRHIVVDPGHGGDNFGALSFQGVYEKAITLAVALHLKVFLESTCDARVTLTREGDKSLTLQQRILLANQLQADLFLSLHANIAFNETARGAEILVLSQQAMAKESSRLSWAYVPQEGRLANASNDAAAAVVKEMMQHGGLVEAKSMGAFLLERLGKWVNVPTRGVKEGVFGVLKGAEMAAMVIEMGFLSNPNESKQLTDPGYQKKFAQALANAIVAYDSTL